jgi:hypothetical protein
MTNPDEQTNKASSEFAHFFVDQITVFRENMDRAQSLIDIYKSISEINLKKRSIHATDILRAAVVFMHAALEELLRSLIIVAHSNAKQSEIDKIPLFSIKKSRQAEKFLLGALLEHQKITVEEVIRKSVEAHFSTQTFNNRQDLVRAMDMIGVKKELAKDVLPTLGTMLERRHQIVHRMDRPKLKEDQWIRATSLNPRHVEKWAKSVNLFCNLLVTAAAFNKFIEPVVKKKG